MFGATFGYSAYGDEIRPWVAFIEGSGAISADGVLAPTGGSKAQGSSSVTGDAASTTTGRAIGTGSSIVEARPLVAPTGVGVIAGHGDVTGDGALSIHGLAVTVATTSVSQTNSVAATANAIGASTPPLSQIGNVGGVGGAMAQGIAFFSQTAGVEVTASASENPPTITVSQPMMLPLVYSNEDNQVEAELKAIFVEMFQQHVRDGERYANVLGMPHLGPREMIEQSLAADGLSIYRGSSVGSGAGAYLLRAWRARNPKRGLHLLKTYLQLLWPNVWTATQMWQSKAVAYPTALVEADGGNHYLTSRVHVTLPARVSDGGDLNAIQAGLHASLPARFVLNLAVTEETTFDIGLAAAYYRGAVAQSYTGNFQ